MFDQWDFQHGVSQVPNAITEQMNEELGSLGQALVTAIFLIFIAMAIQFESPKYSLMGDDDHRIQPGGRLRIFCSWRTAPISMVSMLGFLMMVGNVVNGGILYVETATQLRAEMPLESALVEAGAIRLRPILMTGCHYRNFGDSQHAGLWGRGEKRCRAPALVNVGGPSGVHGPDAFDASHLLPVCDQNRTAVLWKIIMTCREFAKSL